jgi:hypothetical protein
MDMKSRKTRLAALLTAGAMTFSVAAPAVAQTQSNQVAQINQGGLVSALNNVNAEINNIEALNDLTVSDVRVVNVEDVLNNSNVLNNVLRNADIDALQNFLNSNDVRANIIRDVLNQSNVAVSDVVAVDVLSGGDVVVYVQE